MKVVLKIFRWDHILMNTITRNYKRKSEATRWVNSEIGRLIRLRGYGRTTLCDELPNQIFLTTSGFNKKDVVYYEFDIIED